MKKDKLTNFFEKFIQKESFFQNKKILQGNFIPDEIKHRDKQIELIAEILAPLLKKDLPSNIFVYGKTGTGKTVTIKYVCNKISEISKEQKIPLEIIYLNCKLKKIADTEYRLIAQLARLFGKAIPSTGLPTEEVYQIFFDALEKSKKTVLLILDEIDQIVKKTGDELLYNLLRINYELKNSQIAIIGISNNIGFSNELDPRVKSSLNEEEVVFSPYNAIQIQDILKERAKLAFKENILEEGVIAKCAAYAAREHGDARRAIELLRVSGEIAERKNQKTVKIENIDDAEEKVEKDRFLDLIKNQPKQFQIILYSIFIINEKKKGEIYTGELYNLYKEISSKLGFRPLTQRRVSDIIVELDMLGIINGKVTSKGRYGRTREISLSTPSTLDLKIKAILEEDLDLGSKNEFF
ncbi:MAG: ORC1-type DNA replication protein [Nanoarchaeota archaeon]|nr:ORC1-type DNA replication protein [Nanoarchaeota archaeon]